MGKHKISLMAISLLVGLIMTSVALLGHHGTGISYDETHPIVLSGVGTEFLWMNPHTILRVDVKNDQGTVVKWAFEMLSPGVLTRLGWTKTQFKSGDKITMTVAPSKARTPIGICYSPCKVIVNGVEMTR